MGLFQKVFELIRSKTSDDDWAVTQTGWFGLASQVKTGFSSRDEAEDYAKKRGGKVTPASLYEANTDEEDDDDER